MMRPPATSAFTDRFESREPLGPACDACLSASVDVGRIGVIARGEENSNSRGRKERGAGSDSSEKKAKMKEPQQLG